MKLPSGHEVDPDVGRHRPFYSRACVRLDTHARVLPIFNYVVGDTVPGTNRVATDADTNLPDPAFPPCRYMFMGVSAEVVEPVLAMRVVAEGLRRTWFGLRTEGVPAFEIPCAMVPSVAMVGLGPEPRMPPFVMQPGEVQVHLQTEALSGFWTKLKRRLQPTPVVDLRVFVDGVDLGAKR